MIVVWSAQLRAVLALAGGLGAITLGWAVSANTEMPALTLPTRVGETLLPQMPPRNMASSFQAIVERPLFSQSRRPTPPKVAAVETKAEAVSAPPPPPLAATLIGIIISPVVNSAVLRLGSGKSVTVVEGGLIEGWELKRVKPDLAQFRYKDASLDLSFPVHQSSPAQVARTTAPGTLLRRRQ